jgi:hypothetical protein
MTQLSPQAEIVVDEDLAAALLALKQANGNDALP